MPKWNIAIRADRWYGCYVMYYIKKKKKTGCLPSTGHERAYDIAWSNRMIWS